MSCARVSYGVSSECFVVLFFDRFRLPVLGINPGTRGLSLSLLPPFFSLALGTIGGVYVRRDVLLFSSAFRFLHFAFSILRFWRVRYLVIITVR